MFNIINDIFFTTHFEYPCIVGKASFWECRCLYAPTILQALFSTYSNRYYLFNNGHAWRREKSGKVYFPQINLREIGLYA